MTVYNLPGGATFELDNEGVGEVLRSAPIEKLVRDAAHQLAAEVGRRGGTLVYVDTYYTDRVGAAVTLANYRLGPHFATFRYTPNDEAKYGVLIDSATAVGLQVRSRRS